MFIIIQSDFKLTFTSLLFVQITRKLFFGARGKIIFKISFSVIISATTTTACRKMNIINFFSLFLSLLFSLCCFSNFKIYFYFFLSFNRLFWKAGRGLPYNNCTCFEAVSRSNYTQIDKNSFVLQNYCRNALQNTLHSQ